MFTGLQRCIVGVAFTLTMALVALMPLPAVSQAISNVSHSGSDDVLLSEARAFMAAYAEDLRRGDRAALAARYDSVGAHELRPGSVRYTTHEALTAWYATDWQPPAMFEWRDLAYEVVGPDAVVVAGLFAWTSAAGKPPVVQSYVALLRRQADGGLRIGLEAEAGRPPVPWAMLGVGAAVLVGLGMTVGWLAARRSPRRKLSSVGAAGLFP